MIDVVLNSYSEQVNVVILINVTNIELFDNHVHTNSVMFISSKRAYQIVDTQIIARDAPSDRPDRVPP